MWFIASRSNVYVFNLLHFQKKGKILWRWLFLVTTPCFSPGFPPILPITSIDHDHPWWFPTFQETLQEPILRRSKTRLRLHNRRRECRDGKLWDDHVVNHETWWWYHISSYAQYIYIYIHHITITLFHIYIYIHTMYIMCIYLVSCIIPH